MNRQGEAKVRRKPGSYFLPILAGVFTAINATMVLLKQERAFPIGKKQLMNALSEFRILLGKKFRARSSVGRLP